MIGVGPLESKLGFRLQLFQHNIDGSYVHSVQHQWSMLCETFVEIFVETRVETRVETHVIPV